MDLFGAIFGAVGSAASLVGVIFSIYKKQRDWAIIISFILITIMSGTASFFSYKYFKVTQPDYIKEKKMIRLAVAAKVFVEQYPTFTDYWKAGENEGIVSSALIVLEMYKDLYPQNYEDLHNRLRKDFEFAREHRNYAEQRKTMEDAAHNVYMVMKMLASQTAANK